jgi:hemolysin III
MSGLYIFAVVSVIALFGTFFKLFYTGRFEKLSLILYLFMGWLVIIDVKTLYDIIEFNGFLLLILGGASYSIGTIFYSINRKYAHTVWHLFVLAGSILHFFFILYYII